MVKSNIMEFELTPEILDEITFAMEDQSSTFVFDAEESRCRAADGSEEFSEEGRFFPVPAWDSVNGFRLMERFVARLRNPVAREELRAALASGHGVFRSFKNILKTYPELERKWHRMKDEEMRRIVYEWYNTYRDAWGFERVGPEPEDTAEIVESDFSFHTFDEEDLSPIEELMAALRDEQAESLPSDLFEAVLELDGAGEALIGDECVLAAESADGELAGAAVSMPVPEDSLLCARLSFIGIYPEFRGLGLGKELLDRTVEYWRSKGCRWLLLNAPVVPPEFAQTLVRLGFVNRGHLSVLDLAEGSDH